jgi:hypothetical protein
LSPEQSRRPVRPFEAADFIAYENLKANLKIQQAGGSVFFDELRKPLQRMKDLPGAQKWAVYDERHSLEKLCREWNIPKRPVMPPPV